MQRLVSLNVSGPDFALRRMIYSAARRFSLGGALFSKTNFLKRPGTQTTATVFQHRVHFSKSSGETKNEKEEKIEANAAQKYLSYIPGLGLSGLIMSTSFFVADHAGKLLLAAQGLQVEKSPISGIPVAIILGLAVNNMLTLPKSIRPGTSFATTTTLRAGIVCVGAKLSMLELFSAGLVDDDE